MGPVYQFVTGEYPNNFPPQEKINSQANRQSQRRRLQELAPFGPAFQPSSRWQNNRRCDTDTASSRESKGQRWASNVSKLSPMESSP